MTDFVITREAGDYVFVEIEAATRPLFTQAGDESAELRHAIQQTEDWQAWLRTNLFDVSRKLPGIDDQEPEWWVVIGRRPQGTKLERKLRIRRTNLRRALTQLYTYDDVLDLAVRQLNTLRALK